MVTANRKSILPLMEKELVSFNELCKRIGVCTKTGRTMLKDGRLPAAHVRKGRKFMRWSWSKVYRELLNETVEA
jgi:hypothetical protein